MRASRYCPPGTVQRLDLQMGRVTSSPYLCGRSQQFAHSLRQTSTCRFTSAIAGLPHFGPKPNLCEGGCGADGVSYACSPALRDYCSIFKRLGCRWRWPLARLAPPLPPSCPAPQARCCRAHSWLSYAAMRWRPRPPTHLQLASFRALSFTRSDAAGCLPCCLMCALD